MVVGGTDATRIGVAGVWHAIEYHVTGKALDGTVRHDARQLSREDALKMYTLNAAWIAFAEQQRGSLQAGKLAVLRCLIRILWLFRQTNCTKRSRY
ncbi:MULTISPECIES: amidohydrolase family protein [Citrobacter]|uniref:amidohydrolase family protein n=1 Tax=Citrobacter TaxID=544 RepID=UPI000F6626A2|nr:amidohydrolase family protein [Citrobacter portucalensis]MBM6611052.1 amidohydrolase family protein [Citrobacter portucalensis]MDX6976611.1 amidohydrolase family protein [Citrobacter portucalensis]QXR25656.1 amidohydrolase family protein [Citrobacter freundii]